MSARVLIAGVGNVFLGDDAFGVEVARELMRRPVPDGARVVDFGIRGLDLTYALLDGYEAAVLVDATPRGGRPGTLYVLDVDRPAPAEAEAAGLTVEGHNLDPARVFKLAAALGSPVRRLVVVGCEPGVVVDVEEMSAGLSPPVRAAVGEAVVLVEELVGRLLAEGGVVPQTEGKPCRN